VGKAPSSISAPFPIFCSPLLQGQNRRSGKEIFLRIKEPAPGKAGSQTGDIDLELPVRSSRLRKKVVWRGEHMERRDYEKRIR